MPQQHTTLLRVPLTYLLADSSGGGLPPPLAAAPSVNTARAVPQQFGTATRTAGNLQHDPPADGLVAIGEYNACVGGALGRCVGAAQHTLARGNVWREATPVGFRPHTWANRSKFWLNLGDVDRTRTDFGQIRPGVSQMFASSVNFGTILANIWPSLSSSRK